MPTFLQTAAVLLAVPAAAASAQHQRSLNPTPWAHHLTFPESRAVVSAAFSPDSRSLYVHLNDDALSPWAVVVYYWPEVLAAILALLTLGLFLAFLRVRRRPQVPGVPYCRRCNYDLSAHAAPDNRGRFRSVQGQRCPECGTDLARRPARRGHRPLRRLAPIMAAWVIAAGGYGALWPCGVSRHNAVGGWFYWPSERLAAWVKQFNLIPLTTLFKPVDRIIEVDPATGQTRRTVVRRRVATLFSMATSPDGQSLFLSGPGSRTVDRIDVRTGARTGRLRLPGTPFVFLGRPAVIGFSPDGGTAYVQWTDEGTAVSGVSGWDLATGKGTPLVTTPAPRDPRRGLWGRSFVYRPTNAGPSFISYPHAMDGFSAGDDVLRLHDVASNADHEIRPMMMWHPHGAPLVSPDGSTIVMASTWHQSLTAIDVESRTTRVRLSRVPFSSMPFMVNDSLAQSPDGWRLALDGRGGVLVLDTTTRQWLARFTRPPGAFGEARPIFAPDGRRLAAVFVSPFGGGFTRDLALWEIPTPDEPFSQTWVLDPGPRRPWHTKWGWFVDESAPPF